MITDGNVSPPAHLHEDVAWGTVPSAGAWHHLAYVYSGSTNVLGYVDGALSRSEPLAGVLPTTANNPINIGAQRNADGTLASSQYYSGYINSVRVHGGALTANCVRPGPLPFRTLRRRFHPSLSRHFHTIHLLLPSR